MYIIILVVWSSWILLATPVLSYGVHYGQWRQCVHAHHEEKGCVDWVYKDWPPQLRYKISASWVRMIYKNQTKVSQFTKHILLRKTILKVSDRICKLAKQLWSIMYVLLIISSPYSVNDKWKLLQILICINVDVLTVEYCQHM